MGSYPFLDCCVSRNKSEEKEEKKEEEGIAENNFLPVIERLDTSFSILQNYYTTQKINENDKNSSETYRSFNKNHLSHRGDFIIKIIIESLEINYKLCDDFGCYFKPFIEVLFDNQIKTINYSDDKLNTSNLSDNTISNNTVMNNSFNLNDVSGVDRAKSHANLSSRIKEKFFLFNTEEIMTGNSSNSYSSIFFYIKNTNIYTHLTSAHPSITIGEAHIPVNLIAQKKKHQFEGYLRIRLRNIQEIGLLKVKIIVTNHNAASILFNKKDFDNSINLNNSQDVALIHNQVDYWDEELINFIDINPSLIEKYFLHKNTDRRESILNLKLEHIRTAYKFFKEKVFDPIILHKFYIEAMQEENLVSLYQIITQIFKLSKYSDFNSINAFFKLFNEADLAKFYLIPDIVSFNVFIVERFLMFIFNYQKYFILNRSVTIRNNRFLNDTSLIDMLYRNVKNLIELYKQNTNDNFFCEIIRECFIWCINNINELISQPKDNDISDDLKKFEYTTTYNNSISVMSYRICLLKIIDIYSTDSQMMSGLFRIFRKTSQQITNDYSSNLDKKRIDGRPKDISKKFKILLIEKYDGLFIYSLRLMLQKYQHYPELHVNILIIIYQITSSIEYKHLIFSSKKLGLKDFDKNFIIYRGKLKVFSKVMNNLHLNVLANYSEVIKFENEIIQDKLLLSYYEECLIDLYSDLNNFYKIKNNNKKRVEEFIQIKSNELEIHEIVIRTYNNLTKSSNLNSLIFNDTFIFDDIIEYLKKFTPPLNIKDSKDFIKTIIEKKSRENYRKILMNIAENSFSAIKNIIQKGNDNEKEFKKFISRLQVKYDKKSLLSLLSNCVKHLKYYQIISLKLDALMAELYELIEKKWVLEIK